MYARHDMIQSRFRRPDSCRRSLKKQVAFCCCRSTPRSLSILLEITSSDNFHQAKALKSVNFFQDDTQLTLNPVKRVAHRTLGASVANRHVTLSPAVPPRDTFRMFST